MNDFIKNYDENSNKGYILDVDVEYPKNLFNLHSDLPFLSERKKIDKDKDKDKDCAHKISKTSTKSRVNTKKGT